MKVVLTGTVTTLLIAAGTVGLAPGVQAYQGHESTVQSAVLTKSEVIAALSWDDVANPLIVGGVAKDKNYSNSLIRDVSVTTPGDQTVAPDSVGLDVSDSTSERDAFFADQVDFLSALGMSTNSEVVAQSASSITLDLYFNGLSDPAPYGSLTETKAGVDGVAFAWCAATGTTTTTPTERAVCSQTLAQAQVTKWESVPSLAVPSAPTAVRSVAGKGAARVAWTAPTNDGGAPIASYRVTASPGGRSCTTTGAQCTVTGLAAGGSYGFTVRAVNAIGTGSVSSITRATIPAVVPTSVRELRARYPKSKRAVLRWKAPSYSGGAPITRYEYRVSKNGGRTWTRWTSTGMHRYKTIKTWVKGKHYRFAVRTVNRAGASPARAIRCTPRR